MEQPRAVSVVIPPEFPSSFLSLHYLDVVTHSSFAKQSVMLLAIRILIKLGCLDRCAAFSMQMWRWLLRLQISLQRWIVWLLNEGEFHVLIILATYRSPGFPSKCFSSYELEKLWRRSCWIWLSINRLSSHWFICDASSLRVVFVESFRIRSVTEAVGPKIVCSPVYTTGCFLRKPLFRHSVAVLLLH